MAQDRAIIGRRSASDVPRLADHLGQPRHMNPVRKTSPLRSLDLVCAAVHTILRQFPFYDTAAFTARWVFRLLLPTWTIRQRL